MSSLANRGTPDLPPDKLRQLLDAALTVGSGLDLPSVLQRIVRCARELVDARYGALGVLDESGTRLAEFVTEGIDDAARAATGAPPEGLGVLGLVVFTGVPLRVADLRAHPDHHGFPPGHPVMTSFLGVPVRVRDEVYGSLYLTDKTSRPAFTDTDETLVVGLASAAGVAIENARLSARLQRLALLEERERIAGDLHDTVIQHLFAAGLSLHRTVPLVTKDPAAAVDAIERLVSELHAIAEHLRACALSSKG